MMIGSFLGLPNKAALLLRSWGLLDSFLEHWLASQIAVRDLKAPVA